MTVSMANTCLPLEKSMLQNPVELTDRPGTLTFVDARRLADREAEKRLENPMLLAWYDGRRGFFHPTWHAVTLPNQPGLFMLNPVGWSVPLPSTAWIMCFSIGPQSRTMVDEKDDL